MVRFKVIRWGRVPVDGDEGVPGAGRVTSPGVDLKAGKEAASRTETTYYLSGKASKGSEDELIDSLV